MVLSLKVNVAFGDSETLQLESDVTWNGFLKKLVKEFAVQEELLKLYNVSDIDRKHNFQNYVTGANKDKKLIEIAGLQPDCQYEFDLELHTADARDPTEIKVLSGNCSIIAHDEGIFNLDNSRSEYKIQLQTTGWRKGPKGRKLKLVMDSSEERYQYRQYVVEDAPKSRVEIEMKDKEYPTVTLFELGSQNSRVITFEKDDVLLRNTEPLTGKQVVEVIAGGLLQLFTFVTSFA